MWRWLREFFEVYPMSHVHRAVEWRWVDDWVWGERARLAWICTVCQREVR